jgi:hypothetical protein
MISHEEDKFGIIQLMDGIFPIDIARSFSLENNRQKVFQAGEGAGASGSFFFFSQDNRFIIKTMTNQEMERMLKMLDSYIEHLECSNNKSMLARIYGIFTFKTDSFVPMNVMIMENTARVQRNSKMMKFDLKGSSIGRYSVVKREKPHFWRTSLDCHKVLKDKNFMEINNDTDNSLLSLNRS